MKFNVKRPFIFHLILLVYIYIYYPSWLILSIKNRAWVGFLLNGQNLLSMTKVIGQQSLIYLIGVPYKMWLKIAARMLHVIFLKNIQNNYFHHQPSFFHICSNSLTPSLPPAKKRVHNANEATQLSCVFPSIARYLVRYFLPIYFTLATVQF